MAGGVVPLGHVTTIVIEALSTVTWAGAWAPGIVKS